MPVILNDMESTTIYDWNENLTFYGNNAGTNLTENDAPHSLNFLDSFVKSISVVLVSELGDKTFFLTAILAMRYNKFLIFSGAIGALIIMTVLSAFLGYGATSFIPPIYTHYISVSVLFLFGLKMFWEAYRMNPDEAKKLHQEAEQELDGGTGDQDGEDGESNKKNFISGFLARIQFWKQSHQSSTNNAIQSGVQQSISLETYPARTSGDESRTSDSTVHIISRSIESDSGSQEPGERESRRKNEVADDDQKTELQGLVSQIFRLILKQKKQTTEAEHEETQTSTAIDMETELQSRPWERFLEGMKVFLNTLWLIFLAEWGDRSQISTIVLASVNDVGGIILGSIVGHTICSLLAVIIGVIVAKKISVRVITFIGGCVFLGFAIATLISGLQDPPSN